MEKELDKELDNFLLNVDKMKHVEVYDLVNLIRSYNHHINELYYYYKLAKKDTDKKNFIIKYPYFIKEHTLIYVNLGRGFPKELMDGHWCYVIKNFGNFKALVIPTSSIKKSEDEIIKCKTNYVIESYCYKNNMNFKSKLNFLELRIVDLQRVYFKKGYRFVKTPREEIVKRLYEIIGQNI